MAYSEFLGSHSPSVRAKTSTLLIIVLVVTFFHQGYCGFACVENPCFHGICIDYLEINSTHQCYCRDGFTGYSCQINWDECRSNPCLNDGICTDGIASFNCTCPDLFGGALCQYDLTECERSNFCQNNGTCTIYPQSANGTFSCECPPGFSGLQCDLDLSVCNTTENICINGQCVDDIGENFQCQCDPGYTGRYCEVDKNECESQPCQNGGLCINKINDFSCACPFGYTGHGCETKLQICKVNPCKNGAFCLHENIDEFTCYCVPDYHGTLCELKYDDCEPSPKCFNGGSCIDGVGDFSCSCAPSFFGPTCQCTAENMTEPICMYNETVTFPNSSISPPSPPLTIIPSSSDVFPPSLPSTQVATNNPEETILVQITQTITVDQEPPNSSSIEIIISDNRITSTSALLPSIMLSPTIDSDTLFISPTTNDADSSVFLEGSEGFTLYSTMSLFFTPIMTPSIPWDSIITSLEQEEVSSSRFPSIYSITDFETPYSPSPSEGYSEFVSMLQMDSSEMPTPSIATSQDEVWESVGVGNFASLTPNLDSGSSLSSFLSFSVTRSDTYETVLMTLHNGTSVPERTMIISYEMSTVELGESSQFSKYTPQLSLPPEFTVSETTKISIDTSIQSSYLHPDDASPITPFQSDLLVSETQLVTIGESGSNVLVSTVEVTGGAGTIAVPSTLVPFEPSTLTPEITSSTSVPFTTPDPSVYPTFLTTTTLPTNDSQSDICQNYCLNAGKCVSYTIEARCICPFKYVGSRCENMRTRFATTSFTGDSFISYRVPNETINRISVRATLGTNAPDGILLYTSSSMGRLYALIFTQGGHLTLHFSCGSQSMHFVETRTRVDNGYNFTMEFSMEMVVLEGLTDTHCIGQVSVNQSSYMMRGEQNVQHNELYENPIQLIYFGGVSDEHVVKNDDLIAIMPGFKGCLYGLQINEEEKDLFEEAIDGKEVSECSAFGCVTNPCFGSSRCASHNQVPFWQCVCSPGFQGVLCQIRVCDTNPCKNGATCTFASSEEGNNGFHSNGSTALESAAATRPSPICLCPLGFTGVECISKLNITKPSFKPVSGFEYSSFIAYEPIPKFHEWTQLKLHFVIRNTSQIALILYSGHSQSSSTVSFSNPDQLETITDLLKGRSNEEIMEARNDEGQVQKISDFFAITYVSGYVALTWNLGSGTQRIITPSRINKGLNVHTLFAGRSGRQAWLKVDGMRNVTGKSPGPFHRLNVNTELFIGGHDSFRFEGLPHDLPLHKGFEGCIFDFGFRVKNRLYLPRALRGRNIKNCYEEDC